MTAYTQKAPDCFTGPNGETFRRESGCTPNGNAVANRWVLRDADGEWVDFDTYRHDLAERNEIRLVNRRPA